MSTTSIILDSNSKTTDSTEFIHTSESLHYAFTHIFVPYNLPDKSDYTIEMDLSLARAACAAAHAYNTHVPKTSEPQWDHITRMLDNLQASVQSEHLDRNLVVSQMRGMRTGDILAFLIRSRNSAIILTKREDCTLFEPLRVFPERHTWESADGSSSGSYPGFSIEIFAVEAPNNMFHDVHFQFELVNSLCCSSAVDLNHSSPLPSDAQYIIALLSSVLQGADCTADVPRTVKRIRRHNKSITFSDEPVPWRRSFLWLLIRVASQMFLDRSPPGLASYKAFMMFFLCTIARDPNIATLSTDSLHSIASKINRRLGKLRASIPDWLSQLALKACAGIRELLDARWVQMSSPFQNPSQDELKRDTELSLEHNREYIRDAMLTNHPRERVDTTFHPNHRRRGTIDDFLSSNGTFFDEAYDADPEVTLYDVEQSVEQGIDDWIARVTNVDEACTQLEILMDKYMRGRYNNSKDRSIKLLTGIELFVALDKIVVEKIPIFVDYSPEIPTAWLEKLMLHKTTSLHRLACVYQYLSVRHSQSRSAWSVLSNEFTEDSFPVRYYDQSLYHQELRGRIEEDAIVNRDGQQEDQHHLCTRQCATGTKASESSLPASPLYAKVVVFELQCPACVRIWRSAVARIGYYAYYFIDTFGADDREAEENLLSRPSPLQRYFVACDGPPLHVQIQFAYFYPGESPSPNSPLLHYAVRYPSGSDKSYYGPRLSTWRPQYYENQSLSLSFSLDDLNKYMKHTSHTSNDVLAAQADCPTDLSLDEFIAFGQLRSGGSLQWINILRGLRSRTLNLRRYNFRRLLTMAAFEAGPLSSGTGAWIWHQDLDEPSFCDALLDELENMFVEVGGGSIDSTMMGTISLLLTRVFASSPSEGISERTLALLRRVRRKTLNWIRELLYNLIMAPTDYKRSQLLREMTATCQTTFDVDSAALSKVCHSPEDVDSLVSCALFMYTLSPEDTVRSRRIHRLSLSLEGTLRDAILAEVSDYGIGLAVSKTFAIHKPSACRWEQVQHPNSRWLTCKFELTGSGSSRTVHLNLLNGELRAGGQLLGVTLPFAIKLDSICQHIFREQGFFVIPSHLPGMDFTTLATTSRHRVHWTGRDDSLVVRVQCNESKDILELIPSGKLEQDLPPALVHKCVHWLNLSTNIIEIRPVDRLWEESPENWRIACSASGKYRAYKGPDNLVDIRSPTWTMLSKCFQCLNNINEEWSNGLLVTASLVESLQSTLVLQLSATLPHYQLSFSVNSQGELESGDFKHMVYDENQCIGALSGLDNVLVLRQKAHLVDGLISKRVLIPRGYLSRHGDHQFTVYRNLNALGGYLREPSYYSYNIDLELGCLVGNGSLTCTKYLAELHAETSCDWPDPLTGKTGALAALNLFLSAGCHRSIINVTAPDIATSQSQLRSVLDHLPRRYYWDCDTSSGRPVSELLEGHGALPRDTYRSWHPAGPPTPPQVTLNQLLSNRPAPQLQSRRTLFRESHKISSDCNIFALNSLFSSLPMHKSKPSFQHEYIASLRSSARCVREDSRVSYRLTGKDDIHTLETYYTECRANYFLSLTALEQSLGPTTDPYDQVLSHFGRWPPVTADILLRYLAATSPFGLSREWKKCLVSLALLLLDLQRARRLLLFALDGWEEELWKELENEGCEGWDPEEFPDWLLIQIQGNFLIRRAQVETAMEMMSPRSGKNTVMQVNMGEGKSSVIIPIVAAALADGKQLIRVIVPKELTVQMFELLVSRLGGLVNRPIYHPRFSRSPEYSIDRKVINLQIDDWRKLMSRCMAERGILLVQPQHVVSLKLKSVEEQIHKGGLLAADTVSKLQTSIYKHIKTVLLRNQLSKDSLVGSIFQSISRSSEKDTARVDHYDNCGVDAQCGSDSAPTWLSLQKWIHSYVRDILDESDEALRPRFQLIYTMGHEKHMDGYPDRWTITQQVLRLVRQCADVLSSEHPDCIEYEIGPPGSFPHIRIVRATDAVQHLIPMIVEDVMAGRLPSVNIRDISDPVLQRAIRSFVSDKDAFQVPDTIKRVEEYAKRSEQSCMWSGLLLLRGLLTSNILLFSLTERRWRVDYGLDWNWASRTRLAVPYRAKDMPAPNTQFGHPDITIILTCLSYYYGGLSEEQLRISFEILLDEDDPTTEYAFWVKDYSDGTVPDSIRVLGEINIRPSEQWDKVVFPLFSRNQAAIDFYLSRVVFPKEAKEFPLKLSASSWDLAEKRDKLITGFSGTNDARWLLPTSIAQRDPDHQRGTNARVLAYLLYPQNDSYRMAVKQNGNRPTMAEFLQMIATQLPKIRVLLDVGAQILEHSNEKVAQAWLEIVRDAAGAIYFDQNDELMVLMRNGKSMSMVSSPLSRQLDRCVVYLDHVHTRGTDLKLPIGSRAAVTLGPKVTKDSLVQGCMRMRKLGHGHSVMFFAPPEVDRSIRALSAKKDLNTQVTTVDILRWAIYETWTDIQQQAPYWAQQGMSHKSKSNAWSRFCNNNITSDQLSEAWLEPELKSLEDLYAPSEAKSASSTLSELDPGICQLCKDLGVLSLPTAQMEDEQEREVSREKEREREVEPPPNAEPAKHCLHEGVVAFVKTGTIPPSHFGSVFHPVFATLDQSSAAAVESDVWSPFIFATADFCNTIEPNSTQGTIDQYLRPVQWVLSSKRDCDKLLVLLSPFEVDCLMPDIRASEHVHLHVYAPRTSQRMKPSDDLKLYAIPPLPSDWTPPWALIDQLNVFAGQLYLRDYTSYLRLCHFLEVPTREMPNDGAVRRNIFDIPGSFEENEIMFSNSPLPSVKALLGIRTRGRPFAHTHMGKILYGRPLTMKDFEGPLL